MFLKGLNDMNIRYLQNGEPTTNTTSPLWESGTLAEDKGAPILRHPFYKMHRTTNNRNVNGYNKDMS